jgi:hypothetical protein
VGGDFLGGARVTAAPRAPGERYALKECFMGLSEGKWWCWRPAAPQASIP